MIFVHNLHFVMYYYVTHCKFLLLAGAFRYLLHYVLSYMESEDAAIRIAGFAIVFLFVGLIGYGNIFLSKQFLVTAPLVFAHSTLTFNSLSGRIYLGMHSLIDVIGGLGLGFITLTFWLLIHENIDSFVVSGQNGMWTCTHDD